MRQAPTGFSFGCQQKYGIWTPMPRDASRTVVPLGTVTCRPSIVSVTVLTVWVTGASVLVCSAIYLYSPEFKTSLGLALAMLDVVLPFLAPVLDRRLNRHHRGITQRTDS